MVKTNVIPSLVASNAPGTTGGDIRAIKEPVAIPNLWLWLWTAVALAVVVAVWWWLWRKRQQKPSREAPTVVVPPHERAMAKLREALDLIDQPRPFCILVSDTVRVYLEERFHLRAPERTTEEFLEELQSSPKLTFEQKRTLGEFLMGCDLVKFARYEPGRSEVQGIYDAAVRLVEETQEPPQAPMAVSSPEPQAQ